jgi:hypothetical protein
MLHREAGIIEGNEVLWWYKTQLGIQALQV